MGSFLTAPKAVSILRFCRVDAMLMKADPDLCSDCYFNGDMVQDGLKSSNTKILFAQNARAYLLPDPALAAIASFTHLRLAPVKPLARTFGHHCVKGGAPTSYQRANTKLAQQGGGGGGGG